MREDEVPVVLSGDEALVLYELASRARDSSDVATVHPAERLALAALASSLERSLTAPFEDRYHERVAEARERLARA